MYNKNFFLIFFSLLVNCTIVSANQSSLLYFTLRDKLANILMQGGTLNWSLIITVCIFIIFAYIFCDALIIFSPMSRNASIAVGILFAVIALSTGFIKDISNFLVSITDKLGYYGTIYLLIGILLIYFIWKLILYILLKCLGRKK